ncbi:MAG: Clp protease N-terminal domain-containing protein [bacterium]|nr:Clp protease N-terminal domain-containing protein [bacterium]
MLLDDFTDRSRRVIELTFKERQTLGHLYIGTGHILLGLITEGTGVAASVLSARGIFAERVRAQVQKYPDYLGAEFGDSHYTYQAQEAIDSAREESRKLGDQKIGTEHLLLGIVCNNACGAIRLLSALHVRSDHLRRDVMHLLGKDAVPVLDFLAEQEKNISHFGESIVSCVKERFDALRKAVNPDIRLTEEQMGFLRPVLEKLPGATYSNAREDCSRILGQIGTVAVAAYINSCQ